MLVRTLGDPSVSRLCQKTLCFLDVVGGRICINLGEAPYTYFRLLAVWKPILEWVLGGAVSWVEVQEALVQCPTWKLCSKVSLRGRHDQASHLELTFMLPLL